MFIKYVQIYSLWLKLGKYGPTPSKETLLSINYTIYKPKLFLNIYQQLGIKPTTNNVHPYNTYIKVLILLL